MSKTILRPLLSIAGIVISVMASIDCTSDRAEFKEENLDAGTAAPPAPFVAPDAEATDSGALRPEEECRGETQFVYVVTTTATIQRFDPRTLTFAELGRLNCPDSTGTFSMGVDRYGTAWVEYRDGRVFNVPLLSTQECTEVPVRRPQGAPYTFGMAFSKDESATGESLFLGGNGLWKVDPRTFEMSRVGPVPAAVGGTFELTGTGDGRLYGYASNNGVVVRLDPATGNGLEMHRTSAVGGTWAFAQWGGDFWLFATSNYGPNTTVTRYNPVTQTSTVAVEDAGLIVIGAGVSTCAPYEPPQ